MKEKLFPWYPEEVFSAVSPVLELGFLILEQFQAAVRASLKPGSEGCSAPRRVCLRKKCGACEWKGWKT